MEVFESIEDAGSKAVLERLEVGSRSVDRLAALLLEDAVVSNDGELVRSFETLSRRWQNRRRREIWEEIRAAEEAGDMDRVQRLYDEKESLTRSALRAPKS